MTRNKTITREIAAAEGTRIVLLKRLDDGTVKRVTMPGTIIGVMVEEKEKAPLGFPLRPIGIRLIDTTEV